MQHRPTILLIMAAGQGVRFGGELPKQYSNISNNKTILDYTIKKFEQLVDNIFVVVSEDDSYIDNLNLNVNILRIGGKTRFESCKNAVYYLHNNFPHNSKVLIHDACRPYVRETTITSVIEALDSECGVVPVTDITESLKYISDDAVIENMDRSEFALAQTPQGFELHKLYIAYNSAHSTHYTDDVWVFKACGYRVKTVKGSRCNIKITTKEDIRKMNDIRVGFGVDVHAFKEGSHIMLGGVKVEAPYAVEAHSDGDVLLHSLCDAILGSIGLGDIGVFFPPSDAKWKNAQSKVFVAECLNKLKEKGGTIVNIDFTLMAEEPKIKNYREEILQNIATMCNIEVSRVNLGATTTEKMGFLGREEGIAANCVVMVSFE